MVIYLPDIVDIAAVAVHIAHVVAGLRLVAADNVSLGFHLDDPGNLVDIQHRRNCHVACLDVEATEN